MISFSIKIHDLNELKEVYTIVDVEEEKGKCKFTMLCVCFTDTHGWPMQELCMP